MVPNKKPQWTQWHPWDSVHTLVKDGGVDIPNKVGGVYEARLVGSSERLVIARSSDLRWAIREELVRRSPNSTSAAGRKIRENEDLAKVQIRWMVVENHADKKDELCLSHIEDFGYLPKYNSR